MDGRSKPIIHLHPAQLLYLWQCAYVYQLCQALDLESKSPARKGLPGKKSAKQMRLNKKPLLTSWCIKEKPTSVRRSASGVPIFANGALTGAFSRALNDDWSGRGGYTGPDDFGREYPGRLYTLYFDPTVGKRMWIPIESATNAYQAQKAGANPNDYGVTTREDLVDALTVVSVVAGSASGVSFFVYGTVRLTATLGLAASAATVSSAFLENPSENPVAASRISLEGGAMIVGTTFPQTTGLVQFYLVSVDLWFVANSVKSAVESSK